ncbi:MAG: hypothetical protein M1838_003487 [Thelocarpon superellum]|nr:MAG: hypothetical protein M1838_003487 [Thelocarpon superellum]
MPAEDEPHREREVDLRQSTLGALVAVPPPPSAGLPPKTHRVKPSPAAANLPRRPLQGVPPADRRRHNFVFATARVSAKAMAPRPAPKAQRPSAPPPRSRPRPSIATPALALALALDRTPPVNAPRAPAAMRRPVGGKAGPAAGLAPPSPAGAKQPKPTFYRPAPTPAVVGPVPANPSPKTHTRASAGDESWRANPEIAVRVRGLPKTITTQEVWDMLHAYGAIDFIELFEDRSGQKDGCARIRFRPPPAAPFWTHAHAVPAAVPGGRATPVEMMLERARVGMVPHPAKPHMRLAERTVVPIERIDFGFMSDVMTMTAMHRTVRDGDMSMVLDFNLDRREMDIQFDLALVDPRDPGAKAARRVVSMADLDRGVGGLNRVERYRFRIPLEQLRTMHQVGQTARTSTVVISLDSPPNFYRKAVGQQMESSHEGGASTWSEWDTWYRTTDIVYDPTTLRHAPLALQKARPVIDIGRWTTYRLELTRGTKPYQSVESLCAALAAYNVPVHPAPELRVVEQAGPAVWEWLDPPVHVPRAGTSSLASLADLQAPPRPRLDFAVRYQLEVCLSHGYLNEYALGEEFLARLARLEKRRAVGLLEQVALRKQRVYRPLSVFAPQYLIHAPVAKPKIPAYCIHARKAIVTPSTIYFASPQVETSNRVVRRYLEHADRFLRVQFTDEKFQGRIHSSKRTSNEVLTRIQRTMVNGITVGARHFDFLAFGNSQFRENGAYFFAPTPYLCAADIRAWMGNFSKIRVPAKYAARLGQCFSTTRAIHGTRVQIQELDDVTTPYTTTDGRAARYTFTDGVGKISDFLARLVASELSLPSVPSVLQFRLGGCKGVLTTWPDARDRAIYIRPSQYKFPAIHNGLEINRWSQFSAAALNRQLIVVLSALGVPDEVFLRKQAKMLADIEEAARDQALAVTLLGKFVDPNQMTRTLAGMILDGFMTRDDPFVVSLLQLWRAWSIKYLKEKAKILVADGAFLLGCTDETQTLQGHRTAAQPGPDATAAQRLASLPEIFLQVPRPGTDDGGYVVVQGVCVLARNPSLHPGDVRVVRAVDQPGLRHLRDVVVLPQTGDRDLASMCSGGDLDGDDYIVMWDEDLIPREWNHAAMDYTPAQPDPLDRGVTTRDIINFFVNYMKNDQLGKIATSHLAHADRFGVKHPKCRRLAELHSDAVDYAKSGKPAAMEKELEARQRPHFMESRYRSKDRTYVSDQVLGKLYDQVQRVKFTPHFGGAFDARILQAHAPSAATLNAARDIKVLYDADMRRIMAQYDVATEFEIWTTFVLEYSATIRDFKFHEEMGQISTALKDRYRAKCTEQAGGHDRDALAQFVVAMYTVTQQEVAAAVADHAQGYEGGPPGVPVPPWDPKSMPLMSFPWIFHQLLGKIANHDYQAELPLCPPAPTARPGTTAGRTVRSEGRDDATAVVEEEDVLETADGLTHRGDLLQLFQHDAPSVEALGVAARAPSLAASDTGSVGRVDLLTGDREPMPALTQDVIELTSTHDASGLEPEEEDHGDLIDFGPMPESTGHRVDMASDDRASSPRTPEPVDDLSGPREKDDEDVGVEVVDLDLGGEFALDVLQRLLDEA